MQGRRPGPTVSELEAIEKRAYDEAFAAGREAGMTSAKAEMQASIDKLRAQVANMTAIVNKLDAPLRDMDAEVERQLVELTIAIAKQVVRRELKSDPAQVIAVIRETVGLLPAAARDVKVHLNPADAAVVRERLATPTADRAWTIIEDPVLTRGGCRVTTDTAQIDARLESRIGSVVSAMFGEERGALREEEEKS